MPITSDELARLIQLSLSHGPVKTSLGANGAGRLDVTATPWAVGFINLWRGVAFADGGGI